MVLRLSLSDSLLCLYCFPTLDLGVETQKIDFQSDLSNKLDKNYWSKTDVARMAAVAKSSQSSLSLDVVRAQESDPVAPQKPGPAVPCSFLGLHWSPNRLLAWCHQPRPRMLSWPVTRKVWSLCVPSHHHDF